MFSNKIKTKLENLDRYILLVSSQTVVEPIAENGPEEFKTL